MAGSEDAALVASARGGDRDAFAELVDRHQAAVFRLAYRSTRNRHDAEDITQETFLKAYRALRRYNPEYLFGTWLYGIAVNACRDAARRRGRRREASVDASDWDGVPDGQPGPAERALSREQHAKVIRALLRLDPEYRLVVVLYYQEERSHAEIAEWLGIPVTTVKNRLFRARRRLEQLLAPYVKSEVSVRALETE